MLVLDTSLAGAGHVPGFHPEGRYETRIQCDGSGTETLTYRVEFGEPTAGGVQELEVRRLAGAEARDDDAAGAVVAQGQTGEVVTGDGITVWAGTSADPFYLDLNHLAHVLEGLQHQRRIAFGDWTAAAASSTFAGSRVSAVVLEVPSSDAELRPGRDIAVWNSARLATDAGGWRQVNRAGIPMVWPLFRAYGGDDDSPEYVRDTGADPSDDPANDGARVAAWVAAAVEGTGVGDPVAYGRIVAARLLPDVLPYRVGTPAAFSFAGFNGRALADNAPEVMYSLVTNSAIPTGLSAASAAETRQATFPYVVPSA